MSKQPLNKLIDGPLGALMDKAELWRASRVDYGNVSLAVGTGFPVLDQYLPGKGWPGDGLTELLHDQHGIGEGRIITPALVRLSQQGRCLLWVSPPYIPYAPALAQAGIDLARILIVDPKSEADKLWVMEKALASQSCGAVIAWPKRLNAAQLRRLQVACKAGKSLGILYRSMDAAKQASPAELRLQLQAAEISPLDDSRHLNVKILKRKGGWATDYFDLKLDDTLNQITPDFSELRITRFDVMDLSFINADTDTVTTQTRIRQ